MATDLHATSQHKMEEDGISHSRPLSIETLEHMIDEGKIVDALTPAVLYKVKLRLATNKIDRS